MPGKNSELKYCEEYFNLIASIIRACSENFVVADANDTEMTDSTLSDSRLMRDKESYQNPNQRAGSAQNQSSGRKNQPSTAQVNMEKLIIDEDGNQLSANYLMSIFIE